MGPVLPPHAAARPVILPWAPVPTPHAAARPVICHGPCTASSCCHCQVQSVSWVTLYGLPLLLSLHRHILCSCATFRSPSHCWVVPFFHRVLYGLPPLLLPPRHTCGLHHFWFWHPWSPAQMSEVCVDSKIDGTHLHVI
ncbi:unnamed protein product, partial [Staurois parvus]